MPAMATVTVQRPAWNHLQHGGGELAGSRRIAGGDIGAKLRFKYFRRPMVPYLQAVPPGGAAPGAPRQSPRPGRGAPTSAQIHCTVPTNRYPQNTPAFPSRDP